MKALIIIILASAFLFGCSGYKNEMFPFSVIQKNGSGLSSEYIFLSCDSATMISKQEAIAWVKGTKIKVFADQITISTNTYIK